MKYRKKLNEWKPFRPNHKHEKKERSTILPLIEDSQHILNKITEMYKFGLPAWDSLEEEQINRFLSHDFMIQEMIQEIWRGFITDFDITAWPLRSSDDWSTPDSWSEIASTFWIFLWSINSWIKFVIIFQAQRLPEQDETIDCRSNLDQKYQNQKNHLNAI